MSLRFQSSAKQMLNPSKSIFAQKKEQSLADAGRNSDPRQKYTHITIHNKRGFMLDGMTQRNSSTFGAIHKWRHHPFFEICDPSLPPCHPFYEIGLWTNVLLADLLPPKWVTSFMNGPLGFGPYESKRRV